MDIERARTFLEIVHTGSFLNAALRLHVTQTTVSARIRTLEDELGRKLFVRNRNGARLTAAGREFERYAQSLVQIWERARHQLAIPAGSTSVLAVGSELSLWNPLMLDWLVWMRRKKPRVAIHAHVGVPDQLVDQLRTGVLDIAVLYAPKLLPGFKVELLEEEKLVLVRSRPPVQEAGEDKAGEDYVHVDWGPQFSIQQHGMTPAPGEPGLMVDLGPLGLHYILRAGGSGYFRRGMAEPHIAAGELEIVPGAAVFTYPAYAVYADRNETHDDIRAALQGLKKSLE